MFTVGLTGGIGSGKSTVADLFAGLGVPVIDTDLIAHQLTKPGGEALDAIRAEFPDAVMQADGTLDRAALRRIVFSDATARRQLEAILHPRIRREVEHALAALRAPYAMIVIPLLVQRQDRPEGEQPEGHLCPQRGYKRLAAYPLRVETGGYRDLLSRVLVVDCTEAQQIERAMSRSKLSREEVVAILATQASRVQRLAAANDVILNAATPDALRAEVAVLHQRYLDLAAAPLP